MLAYYVGGRFLSILRFYKPYKSGIVSLLELMVWLDGDQLLALRFGARLNLLSCDAQLGFI
jgi:hypothetical protein